MSKLAFLLLIQIMNKFKKQSKTYTTLHNFAKTNHINQIDDRKQSLDFTIKRSQQSKFGLSTLLHFNNNSTISSIKSKIQYSKLTLQSPQFANQAKLEIQELKLKRLELEKKWGNKPVKHSSKIQDIQQSAQQDQSYCIQNQLEESQVQVYSVSLEKTKYEKIKENNLVQDRFILDLKNQIKTDKVKQFIYKIKRAGLRGFITSLKKYLKVKQFRLKSQMNFLKMIAQEWKQLSDRTVERQNLRKLVVQRIKKRRVIRELSVQPSIDKIIF